jgi:branched-chain amino acid transport system permease protein
MGVLLVEHDMPFVMGLADRLVVMDFGNKLAEGPAAAVRRDRAVIAAYLGAPAPAEAA